MLLAEFLSMLKIVAIKLTNVLLDVAAFNAVIQNLLRALSLG